MDDLRWPTALLETIQSLRELQSFLEREGFHGEADNIRVKIATVSRQLRDLSVPADGVYSSETIKVSVCPSPAADA